MLLSIVKDFLSLFGFFALEGILLFLFNTFLWHLFSLTRAAVFNPVSHMKHEYLWFFLDFYSNVIFFLPKKTK